jgi:ABC-type lipoprotein export system ATPase subunit
MNDPSGSTWRKWDLHIHTPASIVHQYEGADPWSQFLNELESLPSEFKVIGVSDYIFLDGYRRILAERQKGRLKNLELVLPVIELRLDKFGGSQNHLSRVNYHVIFSDELSPDLIEQHFLNALCSKYTLSPQYSNIASQWQALPTRHSLEDLGRKIIESVPGPQRKHFSSPLVEGFNNLTLNLRDVQNALQSHYFTDRYVTAIGRTEWADIKWNDHSIADKKNIINSAGLVFTAVETSQHWQNTKATLAAAGVNDRLIDCSDAHHFRESAEKDRIGNSSTWVKADPTFAGLQQILIEPDDRIWVGGLPPQLARVQSNPTKYLTSIEIKRKEGATIGEVWFDNTIPLNSGLVAIIGNKGKGKSALTDIIGLLANTKHNPDFTFLSSTNFRQQRDNKARHFKATLTLASGTPVTRGLEENVDETQPELVKYIPQNFLEKICTQLGKIEESDFDRELKKVIFSHVDNAYRLEQPALDDLIAYKTAEATEKIAILKQELHRINEEIATLEEQSGAAYRKRIENLLEKKRKELSAHEAAQPTPVAKPESDPSTQQDSITTAQVIDIAKQQLKAEEDKIIAARDRQAVLARQKQTADRLSARLANLEHQLQVFTNDSKEDFLELSISQNDVLRVTVDRCPLDRKASQVVGEQQTVESSLDPTSTSSLFHSKLQIEGRIQALQNALDEPNRRYRAYEDARSAWEKARALIVGDKKTLDTVAYYESQLSDLSAIPSLLAEARNRRLLKSKEIHTVIRALTGTYRELYAPVNRFIESRPLARDKFHLNFEVAIVDTGFRETFFDFISQGVGGTFCGVEAGSKMLRDILERQDFDTEQGIETFLKEMEDALHRDRRPGGREINVGDQLKKSKTTSGIPNGVVALYDFIYSLGYIKPRYALRMGAKELSELSPGERGTLLLVFYLLVDKDDVPLVIDQPEENLDNQTVYELLVPCMKEAKQRRQVLIVTHNPNLAVVCDAEQVICADLDKAHNYTMHYRSGAIENPDVNKAIVDILEGTMPAFHNRGEKYFEHSA